MYECPDGLRENLLSERHRAMLFSFHTFPFFVSLGDSELRQHLHSLLFKTAAHYNSGEQQPGVSDTPRHLLQISLMLFAFTSQ